MKKLLFFITTLFLCVTNLFAQVSIYKTYVNIRMVPDHADWIYQPGENPRPGPQQPVLFTDKYFIHRGFGNGFSAKIRRRC